MYYSSVHGQRSVICRALSEDGVIWTKDTVSNPVFVPGAPGEWDDAGVAPGTVLIQGDTLKMWYSGRQANQPERTGYATSTDGVTWTRYPGNPVIEAGSPGSWDDQWQAPPEVLFDGTEYRMWYCGNVSLGYAPSADGLSWTKYHNNPILRPEASGWEQGVIYCSAIVESDGVYRYWYSGGSQIGFAVDWPVPFVAQHPTRLDFLPRGVGQVPDTLDVTVMNYGRQSAQVTDVTLQSADF